MGDKPPGIDDTIVVSPFTTCSISVNGNSPELPFYEVQKRTSASQSASETICLNTNDLNIWQTPSETIETPNGRKITPP